MSKSDFHLRIIDPEDIEFLKAKPDLTFFLREVINDLRTGKLNYSEKNVDADTKIQRLRKLRAEATIKELELKYMQNFGYSPSSQGKSAIKTNVYTNIPNIFENDSEENSLEKDPAHHRELTNEELNEFVKLITLEPADTGFKITCLICKNIFHYRFRLEAIFEANRHLNAIHGKKFLK